MFTIYLKTAVAIIISLIPFCYAFLIKPRQKVSDDYRSFAALAKAKTPMLLRLPKRLIAFLRKLHRGMRTRTSCRRFFVSVMTIMLLVIQAVDSWASTAAMTLINTSADYHAACASYGAFLSSRLALFFSFIFTLMLFNYRLADTLLTDLHKSRKFYCFTGVLALLILMTSSEYFILAEMLFLILICAYFYCQQTTNEDPKNRRPIFSLRNMGLYKAEAA